MAKAATTELKALLDIHDCLDLSITEADALVNVTYGNCAQNFRLMPEHSQEAILGVIAEKIEKAQEAVKALSDAIERIKGGCHAD
ncbi:hypothetical protein [Achromobacter mucicolens]|uniref:hypothetical protein n=1 Tax=Achromobacter mucicolens TaxID=1389922 RepID=UPI0028AF6E50|nr:hypothetical protein [Achromobacter mucicolens]